MALYPLLQPLIFALDAERAHRLTIGALKLKPGRAPLKPDPRLAIRVAGLDFPGPVGLAAGFDKDAEVPDAMLSLGFGFVEVGTLTPLPQARPRGGVVGVNVGANKDSADRIADYAQGARAMADVADYLAVNISSPNTPGLRALQDPGALDALLEGVVAARGAGGPPVFLKVAPDLAPADIDAIVRVALDRQVDALIVANTTIGRPPLRSRHAGEAGGLSGAPLRDLALARLRDFRGASGRAIPLVAAGGIASAEDAWARIRAGASLVQLYSALIYEGPGLARRIAVGLAEMLAREGYANVAEAVG